MAREVYVAGVGMTPFVKPRPGNRDYPELVAEAGGRALADAGIGYGEVRQVVAGYVYGDSCAGHRGVYELGRTGVPVMNVTSNCSTGSSALVLARQLISGGVADVVLAVGFEKMNPGSIGSTFTDRTDPLGRHLDAIAEHFAPSAAPPALKIFGNAGTEHMARYGSTEKHFAAVAAKNHRHSVHNPNAQFRAEFGVAEILASPRFEPPLTKLQCSPTSDGAAAAVLMSADAVAEHGLAAQAVRIAGQALVTDTEQSFSGSAIDAVGGYMSARAAELAYAEAGVGPDDLDVIELHDCFSVNEVITYEALGLCGPGEGHLLVERDETTYGGRWVVNPSGGLISKGHPLGATGLAQCAELTWQLRGRADARQVDGARTALQHNIGLGGSAVVTIYRAPTP
jgi:acetyl-CoA acetyltransferase